MLSRLIHNGNGRFSDRREQRQVRFVNIGALIAIAMAALWTLNSWMIGVWVMVVANLLAMVAYVPVLALTRYTSPTLAAWGLNAAIHCHVIALAYVVLGPETNVHFWFLLLAMVPILIFPIHNWRHMLLSSVLSMVLFFVAHFGLVPIQPLLHFPQDLMRNQTFNVASVLVAMALYLGLYVRDMVRAEAALEREHARAEKLLLNILPASIAARLKDSDRSIADEFSDVTILFADIVGFTSLSQSVSASELVEVLNLFFSAFDQLSEKYGLEKIKTIGDAYMLAGGLPSSRPDHAIAVAHCALEMLKVAELLAGPSGQSFQIRIGINSGPVVAGVIGEKKFTYDLWGDAVNLASRMESHGTPGTIQVTESSYTLLRQDFELEARGSIDVKGKGSLRTWWLKGPKHAQA